MRLPTPRPIDDLSGWLASFQQPTVALELLVLAVCTGAAWALVKALQRALGARETTSIWLGRRVLDGVLFPLLLLFFAYVARDVLDKRFDAALFKLTVPVLMSLLAIRVGVKVLQAAFAESLWARALEQTISWVAGLGAVLWISGLWPLIVSELDDITWTMGGSVVSLRELIAGTLTAGSVLLITLWISSAIEERLLRSATGNELSLRKAVSNATRALLMFIGVIIALTSVGIDLTALSVLGGAIGVGIGFGLQKLALNYISGFVILAERTMRIGDSVRVDGFEGRISDIRARYTVIRSLGGRESIVPNELLVTSRVENLSLADTRIWQSTVLNVGYDSDVDLVVKILCAAAQAQERVLKDPAPSVMLSGFAADGLEMTVGYWLGDPENGTGNIKSQVNMAILAALRAHHIDIPYPQRVLRQV